MNIEHSKYIRTYITSIPLLLSGRFDIHLLGVRYSFIFVQALNRVAQLKASLDLYVVLLQGSQTENTYRSMTRNIKSRPMTYAKVICVDGETPTVCPKTRCKILEYHRVFFYPNP